MKRPIMTAVGRVRTIGGVGTEEGWGLEAGGGGGIVVVTARKCNVVRCIVTICQ